MLTNPKRGWQLDSMVTTVHRLVTTFITTLERWLQEELSKHRLELTPKMLANPRRGWQLELELVKELKLTMVILKTWWCI